MDAYALHVFSHKDGRYQTTRAVGLSKGEERALEQFFFGQTNDPGYLASLINEPGIIWRHIGERAALTRVRRGDDDVDGRATLSFETLVGHVQLLAHRLPEMIRTEWVVTGSLAEVRMSTKARQPRVDPERLSEILLALDGGNRVVRQVDPFSIDDVGEIVKRRGREAAFSLSFKSLNPRAPVTVNLVSVTHREQTMASASIRLAKPQAVSNIPGGGPSRRNWTDVIILFGIGAVVVLQLVALRGSAYSSSSFNFNELQNQVLAAIDRLEQSSEQRFQSTKESFEAELLAFKQSVQLELAGLEKQLVATREELAAGTEQNNKALADFRSSMGNRMQIHESAIQQLKEFANHATSSLKELSRGLGKLDAVLSGIETSLATLNTNLTAKPPAAETKPAEKRP